MCGGIQTIFLAEFDSLWTFCNRRRRHPGAASGPMGLLRQRAEMLRPSYCSAISAKLCSYWKCSTKHSLHAFFCFHKFLGNLSTVLPCFFPWYSEETPQSITKGSIPFSLLYPLFFSSTIWYCLFNSIPITPSLDLSPCPAIQMDPSS